MSNSAYWDVLAFRYSRNGNPFVIKLGIAKQRDDGSFAVHLDAIPAPVEGQYHFSVVPQRERGYLGKDAEEYREELG